MGRLSTMYAQQPITYRVPHTMTGFIDFPEVSAGVPFREQKMNEQALLHSVDKPFEVHRLVPVATSFNAGTWHTDSASQELLLAQIAATLKIRSRNQAIAASTNLTPVINLIKGSAERTWEFADPMVLVRGEGILASGVLKQIIPGTITRLYLPLQGYLLIMPPASDQR